MGIVVAAVNVILGLRKSPTSISSSVVQLIAYPYVPATFLWDLESCLNQLKANGN